MPGDLNDQLGDKIAFASGLAFERWKAIEFEMALAWGGGGGGAPHCNKCVSSLRALPPAKECFPPAWFVPNSIYCLYAVGEGLGWGGVGLGGVCR